MTNEQNIPPQNSEVIFIASKNEQNKTKQKSPLEKEASKFNKLIEDIDLLERRVKEQEEEEAVQKKLYFEIMLPAFQKLAKAKLYFFVKMEHILDAYKGKKNIRKLFCEYVQATGADLCQYDEALADFVKKQATLELSLLSKKERKKVAESIKDEFDGIDDEDIDDILSGNPEKLSEKFATQQQQYFKAQQLEDKHRNDIGSLSINEIYKALAKKMHPDLESNETLKLAKEKYMQELSVAKNNKDLKAILVLQKRAIKDFGIDIETVYGLDKLKAFNAVLQQSKNALQSKLSYAFQWQKKKGKQVATNLTEQITKTFKREAKEVKQHAADTTTYTNQMYHIADVEMVIEDYFDSDEYLEDFFL